MCRTLFRTAASRAAHTAATIPRLFVVNPNTSADFTRKIARAATAAAGAHASVVGCVNPEKGPSSIESVYEELLSAAPTLALIRDGATPAHDAIIVACFSDHPAVHAARELGAGAPVVGLLDSAIVTALPLGDRFSIVTTAAPWRPLLRRGVEATLGGSSSRLASVRAIDMPVLALEESAGGAEAAAARICEESRRAVEDDGAEVVVLGCAGMADLPERVRDALGTRAAVVEPVSAAVELAASLARQRLRTAKHALYATPKTP